MFRNETRHALRALTALAQSQGSLSVAELAERARVPGPMLGKVLHRLSLHGLVRGRPGPGGGFRLGRPAAQISLREIVALLEGPEFGRGCLFGLPDCSDGAPCPLHDAWKSIRGRLFELVDRHTIADLAAGTVEVPEASPAGRPTP